MLQAIQLELTVAEHDELVQCEAVIERGLRTFVDVGNALLTIRDGTLYREQYGTFENYCRERWGFTRMRASQMIAAAKVIGNVNNCLQIVPANEAQTRPLTQLSPDDQRIAWGRAVETAPDGKVTGAHVRRVVDEYRQPHVSHNSGNNEWYTPPEYIEAARRVMGTIDLDPASSAVANETVQATTFYSEEHDGLAHDWFGRVWMNPPYASHLIGSFAGKLAEHIGRGDVSEACVLVNNATETGWFNALLDVAACVCLIRGRIKFIDIEGNPSGMPLQGQVLLYIGPNWGRFERVFSEFGAVLHAWRNPEQGQGQAA